MTWTLLLTVLALFTAKATSQGEEVAPPPPVPSAALTCSSALDVQFVLDSSSTIGAENFKLILTFTSAVVKGLDIGEDLTRVSLNRYTSWVDHRFFFNDIYDKEAMMTEIDACPYYGRGTETARALQETARHSLQPYSGWRGNEVATVAVVITDGRTDDAALIPLHARALKAKATRVIAIGVGPEIVESELIEIATIPDSDVIMLSSYEDLNSRVAEVLEKICAAADAENECLVDNGGCAEICVNTIPAFYCLCAPGYTASGTDCVDANECLDNNGGCSDTCTNEDGGYSCSCPAGSALSADEHTCVADSCYGNDECHHTCNNIVNGAFYCTCDGGYALAEDRRTCVDIDECELNPCENECNNTVGGFECGCPDGYGLRADGRTCGNLCYSCEHVTDNAECATEVVCQPGATACQTETRIEEGQVFITKRCKQPEACENNFIQNPKTAFNPTQCNNEPETDISVCRCCCHQSLCNPDAACDPETTSDLTCPPESLFDLPAGTDISCSGNAVGDICSIVCPEGYAPANGVDELICNLKPRSTDGEWVGEISPCVDVDECATLNGGCSHFCSNTNGSYECSCPDDNSCQLQVFDIFFILDSSSSVKQSNFDIMLDFVAAVTDGFTVGQDAVRVGVMTYNKKQFPQINLGDCESNEALTEKLRDIPYKGRGTLTAAAISFTADSLLGEAQGRRAGVPLVVAIITDGRSKDSANLEQAIGRLLTHTDAIFAIGVTKRVNEQELLTIVSGDKTRYRIVDDFSNLNDDLLADFSFCVQPESGLALAPDGKTCDADECADGNGGCSDECINTIGSYICLCPEGQSLVNDGMTCDEDECLVDNGGCQGGCVNTYGGYNCLCSNEFDVLDTDCVDYDECQDDNGGCSDGCNNLPGTFECTCPPGFAIDTDGLNCVEDSCYEPTFPFICDHNCVNVPNGAYFCTCMEGYTLADDGHNCTEIDECAVNNGGCDHLCVNLDGSYECQCNDGFLLRDDGKTCGIACYECINVATNEDCNNTVACPVSADACFTTMRTRNNVTRITKGCQQTLACINNLIQNPRHAGEGPSQCNGNDINSKCECCCFSSYCNVELCPYASDLPTCPGVDAPDVEPRGLVEETGEVMPGGIALLVCPAGFAPSQGGAGLEQLNCVYNFENQTSEWDGNQADIDVCVDINECEINNGGCVAPAECVNFDGGFECVCPDEPTDYVLVDGVICERDECADPDQGGCSHNCTNTIGSFVCFCPPELSLVEDGLTCNFDECREGNGGCMEVCVNTLEGNECACRTEGYEIAEDGLSCQDIDECLIDNGGCDDVCTNLVPGYECSCNAGRLLADDGFSCKDDPCYLDNGGCEQICTVIDDGFICECSPGFLLNEDGSCVDINECESGAADCQYNCTNFEGGYECICPTGMALHVDGKTCGRACYSCQGAATNEECNAQPLEVCTDDAQSCENEVRVHHGVKAIFKRCKQTLSCDNNYIQNPRDAAVPSQCNGGTENDVCRCCCEGHLCNVNERPCAAKQCVVSPADIAVVLDSSSSVKYDNFQTMKAFVKDLLSAFKLGEGEVETALVRYNKKSTVEFDFDSDNTKGGVMDAIGAIPYKGSGTKTGAAIAKATTLYAGRTAPRIMIVITDGRSQDDVAAPAAAARAAGITTLAVGIGNIDEDEIIAIAGDENLAFVTEDFAQLSGIPEMIQGSLCADEDECAVDNGGCSDLCVNTDGSFKCECSEGFVLSGDLFTCVEATDGARDAVNECAENNGGCSDICIDQLEGYNCSCHPGSELDMGGKLCVDIDECAALPCVDGKCINMKGMHYCECAESKVLLDDDATCVDRAAEADCAEGYLALGYGCLRQNTAIINYQSAEEACALDGGRLVKVDDAGMARIVGRKFAGENWIGLDDRSEDGVWVHSDGSLNTFNNWDAGFPGDGDCAYLDGVFKNENCRFRRASVCEIPRAEPVLVFTSSWPNGAQAKLYMASGYAKVTFPADVLEVNAWFCKMVARDGNTIFFSQDANEKQAGDGRCEFVVQAAARFPSGGCSAANSSEDELLAMAE